MVRKLFPLLAALALLLAAIGGAAAVDAGTTTSSEETPNDASIQVLETTDNDSESESSDGQMWIPEDQNRDGEIDDRFHGDGNASTDRTGSNDSERPRTLLPEDRNGDGKIDERFRSDGTDSEIDAGICLIGADSTCNGPSTDLPADDPASEPIKLDDDSKDGQMWIPEDQNRDGKIDDRFHGDENDSEDSQLWIPEDQNRDGEIDDRFRNDSVAGGFASLLLSVIGSF